MWMWAGAKKLPLRELAGSLEVGTGGEEAAECGMEVEAWVARAEEGGEAVGDHAPTRRSSLGVALAAAESSSCSIAIGFAAGNGKWWQKTVLGTMLDTGSMGP